jgi:quinol monooxygenase YgiN
MNVQSASRVVLIHTREHLLAHCGQLLRDSVDQANDDAGCIGCQLHSDVSGLARWIIQGVWLTEDSMRMSVERVFQPFFERLIASNALLSIRVCQDERTADGFDDKPNFSTFSTLF